MKTLASKYSVQELAWVLSVSRSGYYQWLERSPSQRALAARRPAAGWVHHSDRGSQYASGTVRTLLHSWQIQPSMSAAGCCYENAAMEAFWSTLKTELAQHRCRADLQQIRLAIFDYIELFYNPKRHPQRDEGSAGCHRESAGRRDGRPTLPTRAGFTGCSHQPAGLYHLTCPKAVTQLTNP